MRLALGAYADHVDRRIAALVASRAAERIWSRDATFWGGDEARQESVAGRLGWLDIGSKIQGRLGEIDGFAREVRDAGFVDVVLLGMGGSSLAPEVLRRSLARNPAYPALHVLDTTDPATILELTRRIDPVRTLFCVSSKSGTTLEPNALFAYFEDLVRRTKGDRAGRNFIAITDPATALEALANAREFRRVFRNPPDIGGRYSALSYFGMVPVAACGIDVAKLVARGVAAEEAARSPASDALRLGAALGELAVNGRDKVTFIVAPGLESFGLWAEQLIAESTGKDGRGMLPVAGEPLGSPSAYGQDRVFVQLRLGAGENAEQDAMVRALAADGHPLVVIELDDFYDLGREFFRWQFAIAVAGHVLGINPFDEPNVQESKDNTSRVLREFERSGTRDVEAVADHGREGLTFIQADATARDDRSAVTTLLRGAQDGGYFAITAYLPANEATDAAFCDIRREVRDATHAATTLGYGPRFLHSTGQFHKGGPPTGRFLQLTSDARQDLPIPGKPYTFGQLERAQAIGDFQSLASHGRPVLRAQIKGEVGQGLERLRDEIAAAIGASEARSRG